VITQQLLDKLRNDEPVFGVCLKFAAPALLEVMGPGWDFIWIDLQHGYVTEDALKHLLCACDLIGVSSLVRPPGQARQLISRILDWDAGAVIVPQVHTAEEAADVVRAAKFPPVGDRSYGGPRVLFRNGRDYNERANERQLVVAQIESPQAVENAEAIAAVEGVDVLMLAPDDLRLRIGVPRTGSLAGKEILEAADVVGAAAAKHGKACMAIATETEHVRLFMDRGFRLFLVGSDSGFVLEGMESTRAMIDGL